MIARLRGAIVEKNPTRVILDAGGVGYDINITLSCFEQLPADGDEAIIHTYLSVSENAMNLYGFASSDEKEVFLKLISISGIGPKLGQVILSGIPVADLVKAIQSHDINRLKGIPGIGKKTAERLIVELKDKMNITVDATATMSGSPANISASAFDESVLALMALGYKKADAEKSVLKILQPNPELSVEEVIKTALRQM